MSRSPTVLAALLSAAMPSVEPVAVAPRTSGDDGVDVAVVTGSSGERWQVHAPSSAAGGADLEREVAVLAALGPLASRLPFTVPQVVASTPLAAGGRAVVVPHPAGSALDVEDLATPRGLRELAPSVGRSLAAIHELPTRALEDAGAPVFTAAGYRDKRLDDLDRAAGTGLVPSVLLQRWEERLEAAGRWRFHPVVVHGDLAVDDLVVSGGERPGVSAIGHWGSARVADPADDLAWLASAAPDEVIDAVLAAYAGSRTCAEDPHLLERAELAGEMAIAQYLLHGVRTHDEAVVEDAHAMLVDLESAAQWAQDQEGDPEHDRRRGHRWHDERERS